MSAVLPDAANTPPSTASERLARSRERLAGWLAEDERARHAPDGPGGGADWLEGLRKNPLSAMAVDALLGWWARQPINTSVHVAEAAAVAAITPLVRRHPVATLGGAAAAGALVVWVRPWRWRWLLSPALLTGIVAQLAGRLFARRPAKPPKH